VLLGLFLTFCRVVIGVIFAFSFLSKMGNVVAFETTIINFRLLPKYFSKVAAVLFLLGEFIVTVCMAIGGKLLSLGFSLAVFLLVVFSIALVTVLVRKIQTSCNCFGTNSKAISYYDVARNAGFVGCAISGWGVLSMSSTMPATLNLPELALVGFVAVTFIVIWMHLAEIVDLFRLI